MIMSTSVIVGRDGIVQDLWRRLETESVLLAAERRQGKSSVLEKMYKEGPPPAPLRKVFKRSVEDVGSWQDFAQAVCEQVSGSLTTTGKVSVWWNSLLRKSGGGIKGGGVEIPKLQPLEYKPWLEKLIADVIQKQPGLQFVFLWDEFPLMLANIADKEGERAAMEMLDMLRFLRQSHPEIRMVLTGSIGIHHILTRLQRAGYKNRPVNDIFRLELPPLDPSDATRFALTLLDEERVSCDDRSAVAAHIADEMGFVPFYIRRLVQMMARQTVSVGDVPARVTSLLLEADDPLDLRHFRQRLPEYYGENELLVLSLLDTLCIESPLDFDALRNRIVVTEDEERVRDMITLLRSDHYVHLEGDGRYSFYSKLLRRFWALDRGLRTL
jgi:hypothetical protein